MISRLARSMAPVAIRGESGSGKELAARAIHDSSSRKPAAIYRGQLRCNSGDTDGGRILRLSQGRVYWRRARSGRILSGAAGGTLFLDEVAELPLAMQVKLLRAIQERRVRKVGASVEEPVDVRLVSATHQDLGALVTAGRFRQDLFYRLNVIELRVPGLRERLDDIPVLAESILARISERANSRRRICRRRQLRR